VRVRVVQNAVSGSSFDLVTVLVKCGVVLAALVCGGFGVWL
jgi:hypothetical protein